MLPASAALTSDLGPAISTPANGRSSQATKAIASSRFRNPKPDRPDEVAHATSSRHTRCQGANAFTTYRPPATIRSLLAAEAEAAREALKSLYAAGPGGGGGAAPPSVPPVEAASGALYIMYAP